MKTDGIFILKRKHIHSTSKGMKQQTACSAQEVMSLVAREHKMGTGEGGERQRGLRAGFIFSLRKSRNASQRRNINQELWH